MMNNGATTATTVEHSQDGIFLIDRTCGERIALFPFAETTDLDEDKDGDGLSKNEENQRLTSDCNSDSDSDGIPDPEDCTPNFSSTATIGILWTTLARRHLKSTSADMHDHPIPVVIDSPMFALSNLSSDLGSRELISVSKVENTDDVLRLYSDRLIIQPLIYCPGSVFAAELTYFREPHGAATTMYYGIDLPFIGPTILASGTE
jgi:hypothetical protein